MLFEKSTANEVCVRERHFHWWARDREVAREPESGCRVLSCRVRWHMRGGMRVPYHARVPHQREQRSRFLHWEHTGPSRAGDRPGPLPPALPATPKSQGDPNTNTPPPKPLKSPTWAGSSRPVSEPPTATDPADAPGSAEPDGFGVPKTPRHGRKVITLDYR